MFISWWRGNIRSQGEARKKKENRAPGFLSVAQAEDLTGMTQQRVSELRRGRFPDNPDQDRLPL
jgi:hypothetical protein